MKTCTHIQAQLPDFLNNELPAQSRQAVVNHLANCPACKQYHQFLMHTWQLMETEKQQQPSPQLANRVLEVINSQPRTIRTLSARQWAGRVAAIALLVVGIAWGGLTGAKLAQPAEPIYTHSTEYYLNDIQQENIHILLTE